MSFYIQHVGSGLVLDIKNENEIVLFGNHAGHNQLWTFDNGQIYNKHAQ